MDNFHAVLMVLDFTAMMLQVALQSLVMVGFARIAARPDGTAVWFMSVGMILLNAAVAFRSFYWVVMPTDWHAVVGKEPPNIIFAGLCIASAISFLRMLMLLIPESERASWSLLTAPFYPRTLERVLDALRRRKI